jgi:hypothetical protein
MTLAFILMCYVLFPFVITMGGNDQRCVDEMVKRLDADWLKR